MPDVSIVLPVYQVEAFIEDSVRSILDQKGGLALEIILVCDPSRDASTEIAERLALEDRRIVVIRNPERVGLSGCLNLGIDAASSPFIARHDTDDIALPHRLATQYAYLGDNPDISALGTSGIHIDETGGLTGTNFAAMANPASIYWGMHFQNMMLHPAMFFRGEVLRALRYDASMRHAEDYELWVRMMQDHWISNLPRAQLLYRLHANNGSVVYSEAQAALSRGVAAQAAGLLLGRAVDPLDMARLSGWPPMLDAAWKPQPLDLAEFTRLGNLLIDMFEHLLRRLTRPSNITMVYGDLHTRLKRLAEAAAPGQGAPIFEQMAEFSTRAVKLAGAYEAARKA